MLINGMSIARLNFSHQDHEYHAKNIAAIKKLRSEMGVPVAILLDTKGPEYRIKTFENKKISLAGQFAERISEYIEKPIGATAMAVEADGEQMVLCSVDLVAVSLYLMKMHPLKYQILDLNTSFNASLTSCFDAFVLSYSINDVCQEWLSGSHH